MQVDARLRAGDEDDPRGRRELSDQDTQTCKDVWVTQSVDVVEHQPSELRFCDGLGQASDESGFEPGRWKAERFERGGVPALGSGCQGLDHRRPELVGPIVAVVECQPRHRLTDGASPPGPVSDQHGLARPGRRAHQGGLMEISHVLQEAGAAHEGAGKPWRVQARRCNEYARADLALKPHGLEPPPPPQPEKAANLPK